jgi:Ca2+-binding EF-hand superfamily protein
MIHFMMVYPISIACKRLLRSLLYLLLFAILGTALWSIPASPGRSADPPAKAKEMAAKSLTMEAWLHQAVPKVKVPEIAEMLWAMASGSLSRMGPGEGWFHSGQSRYGWDWLAAHHGKEPSETITRKEFQGPADLFDRLDRNHDGELTAEDFDWSDESSYLRQAGQVRQWFRAVDANSNGRISRDEWQAFFAKASKGKDYLTPDDLREMLQPPQKKEEEKSNDDPSPWVFVKGFLTGELGSFHEGPAIGDRAPNFALKTQDGKQEIRLADYHGKKPVVLIFGSFT